VSAEEKDYAVSQCAECGVYACRIGKIDVAPQECPMHAEGTIYEEAKQEYLKPETQEIARNSALTESEGYCKWTRLEEIIVFGLRSGFNSLGLAFCLGLRKEAAEVAKILKGAGFKVESVACKTGAVPKEHLGLMEDQKVRPGHFEPMCNPICQAKLLNTAKTELNILLGLCVGHDTLFLQHSKAPTTILAVKDRVLAHNPLGAIYAGFYFSKRLAAWKK
jgi:uncharacterized metal-binding protein